MIRKRGRREGEEREGDEVSRRPRMNIQAAAAKIIAVLKKGHLRCWTRREGSWADLDKVVIDLSLERILKFVNQISLRKRLEFGPFLLSPPFQFQCCHVYVAYLH